MFIIEQRKTHRPLFKIQSLDHPFEGVDSERLEQKRKSETHLCHPASLPVAHCDRVDAGWTMWESKSQYDMVSRNR